MDAASLLILALLLMLLGLLGTIVPGIPGVPLVWLGVAVYTLLDGFQHLGLLQFLVLTGMGIAGTTAGLWATQLLARAGGASGCSAMLGSCLIVLGLIFFTLPIALLAALAGVFGIEWRRRGSAKSAAVGSVGWLIGWALAFVAEISIAVIMILVFLSSVLR